ncbi:MAG: hypothetical protein NC217_07100 [Muribaculaceae bacterium]|nr:hypothetical protein [Muribaculaceae bacterium]
MKSTRIISLVLGVAALACAMPAVAAKPDKAAVETAVTTAPVTRYYLTLTQTERIQGAKNTGAIIGLSNDFAFKAKLSDADLQNLKRFRFPTLLDGVNYLAPYGWVLDQVYSTTMPGQGNSVIWVLHKDVTKDLQLCEGLTVD